MPSLGTYALDILKAMNGFSVKDTVPEKYQPYLAHWQQRKVDARSRLKSRHQAGLKQAKELADILKADFGATKVMLFGSMLSVNDIHIRSDIDLAVWDLPSKRYIEALAKLMRASGEFGVDLVRIEEAPPSLQSYVLNEGLTLGENVPQSDALTSENSSMAKYKALVSRLRRTLNDLDAEYAYARSQAAEAEKTQQPVYWTAVGLSLHGFYTGLEKAFERIAEKVDDGLDRTHSGQWHRDLLDQMAQDMPDLRPPVIDEKTREYLDKYLSFRHVIRSNYTHRLDPERIAANFYMMEDCYPLIVKQLNAFCDFLASVD